MKLLGLIIITKRQHQLLNQGRKAIKLNKLLLKDLDEMLIHEDFNLKEGNINDHIPPNSNKTNEKEYAKASNFYSLLYKQKLQELRYKLVK